MSVDVEPYSNESLVSLCDLNPTPHNCGYCDRNGSTSNGIIAGSLNVQDYQSLIDRGWRRSGTYIYKPIMKKTCCPLYTIKCDVVELKLTKSQKHVLSLMKNFLENNKKPNNDKPNSTKDPSIPKQKIRNVEILNEKENKTQNVINYFIDNQNKIDDIKEPDFKMKSKHRRLFKKCLKLKKKNLNNNFNRFDIEKSLKRRDKNKPLTIEERLKIKENAANKLEIKTLRSWPPSVDFIRTINEEHQLYQKYQMEIHGDSKFDCEINQFKRFLCNSPLSHTNYNGSYSKGYGSFHQQYRLNGKLIAVGIIDILNYCVSSVYLFYDPDYNFLNLGTYSALREIEFVRSINKEDSLIKWYYLGFYVHSCQKMKYKAQYRPSYLLCPEVYTWHPIEKCLALLDKSKYNRLNPDPNATDSNKIDNFDNIKICRDSSSMKLSTFLNSIRRSYVSELRQLVIEYCKLFGNEVSKNVYIKF